MSDPMISFSEYQYLSGANRPLRFPKKDTERCLDVAFAIYLLKKLQGPLVITVLIVIQYMLYPPSKLM